MFCKVFEKALSQFWYCKGIREIDLYIIAGGIKHVLILILCKIYRSDLLLLKVPDESNLQFSKRGSRERY